MMPVAHHDLVQTRGSLTPKEFRVEVRLRNNRLITCREQLGLGAREMAKAVGMSYGQLLGYEGLRVTPLQITGEWKDSARQLAKYHGMSPEHFWPDSVLAVRKAKTTREISSSELSRMLPPAARGELPPTPEEQVGDDEREQQIRQSLATLTSREEKVLVERFGLRGQPALTLSEVAEHLGVDRERVRQIEAQALRKLRHPSRCKRLIPFIVPQSNLEHARDLLRQIRQSSRGAPYYLFEKVQDVADELLPGERQQVLDEVEELRPISEARAERAHARRDERDRRERERMREHLERVEREAKPKPATTQPSSDPVVAFVEQAWAEGKRELLELLPPTLYGGLARAQLTELQAFKHATAGAVQDALGGNQYLGLVLSCVQAQGIRLVDERLGLASWIVGVIDLAPRRRWTVDTVSREISIRVGYPDLNALAQAGQIRAYGRGWWYESLAYPPSEPPSPGTIAQKVVELLEADPGRKWAPREIAEALWDRTQDQSMSMLRGYVYRGWIGQSNEWMVTRYQAVSAIASLHQLPGVSQEP